MKFEPMHRKSDLFGFHCIALFGQSEKSPK